MISINFTLLVQLANFLILLVVLNFLLFKPILKVLDEREKLVKDSAETRERLSGLADEKITKYESQIRSAKQESMSIRTVSRGEALVGFRKILQDTKAENAKELDVARKTLAGQAEESRVTLKAEAENLAGRVASKLLGRTILLLAFCLIVPAISMAAGTEGAEGGGRAIYDLVMRFVNFAILIGVIIYFARKPVVEGIKGSIESIRKLINDAEESRKQAEIKIKEAEERLARVDQEMEALLQAARQESEMEKERILKEAERAVERLKKDAKLSIQQELKKSQEILRKEVAETAVTIAEEIMREKITPKDYHRFVDEYLNNLEVVKQ